MTSPPSRAGAHARNFDNNPIEQQIRPLAPGRKNWLFAGSVRTNQRAAAIMSLNHQPSLTAMTRLPTSKMY